MLTLDVQFTCPKCGGHMFSSYNCTSPNGMTRYCTSLRDQGRSMGCPVEFHERDDWKYFSITVPAGVRKFKTKDEYDLVMDIMKAQMGPVYGIGTKPL